MSALVFLGVAIAVSVIGSLLVLLRHREPKTVDSSVNEFNERMQALSPELDQERDSA